MPARDFFQGASNAAASTVSGPVDLMSWALQKVGLGSLIGDAPVGGSEWMRRQGLTAPANGLAGLLGEAAGMSLPIAAAAKAPQIAAGLNQAIVNARAPTSGLNVQRGAIVGDWVPVFHGTKAPFSPEEYNMALANSSSAHASSEFPVMWTTRSPKVANIFTARKVFDDYPIRDIGPQGAGLHSIRTGGYIDGGNVIPMKAKLTNPAIVRGAEAERMIFGKADGDWREGGEEFAKFLADKKAAGHDGVIIKANPRGGLEFRAEQYLLFDPSTQAVSKFAK